MQRLLISLGFLLTLLASLHASADFDEGLAAYKAGDYATAEEEFKKAAYKGDALAQHNLGVMYDKGRGVLQDYKEAVKWYRLAAEQGNAEAQHNLGFGYDTGDGVTQDKKEAVKWYRLSAEQGYASAQSNLGLMYPNGEGVIQDNGYAHMWFNIAASNGDESGKGNRDIIAKRMTLAEILEAQKLARDCVARDFKDC